MERVLSMVVLHASTQLVHSAPGPAQHQVVLSCRVDEDADAPTSSKIWRGHRAQKGRGGDLISVSLQ